MIGNIMLSSQSVLIIQLITKKNGCSHKGEPFNISHRMREKERDCGWTYRAIDLHSTVFFQVRKFESANLIL
jgi:hypothetical protein